MQSASIMHGSPVLPEPPKSYSFFFVQTPFLHPDPNSHSASPMHLWPTDFDPAYNTHAARTTVAATDRTNDFFM